MLVKLVQIYLFCVHVQYVHPYVDLLSLAVWVLFCVKTCDILSIYTKTVNLSVNEGLTLIIIFFILCFT